MNSEYQNHIEQIAEILEVTICQAPGLPGMMFVEEEPSRIEIPFIDDLAYKWYPKESQTKYIVALHELGHCYYNHTQGRPPYQDKKYYFQHGVLRSEAEAWKFALENFKGEIKEETKKFALKCFSSYRDNALFHINNNINKNITLPNGNRHHVEFSYDDPYQSLVLKILVTLGGIK